MSKRQAGVGWGAWLQKQGVLNAERKVSFQRIVQVNGPFLFLKPAAAASTWSGSTSPAPPHTGVHTRVHTRAHTLSHSLTHTLTHALTLPHTLTHTAAALSTAGFRAASGAAPAAQVELHSEEGELSPGHALPSELYAAGRLRGPRAERTRQPLALCCEPENPSLTQQKFLGHLCQAQAKRWEQGPKPRHVYSVCSWRLQLVRDHPRVREGSLSSAG